eukprot:12707483-Prorocentrum_lima.AAC.1
MAVWSDSVAVMSCVQELIDLVDHQDVENDVVLQEIVHDRVLDHQRLLLHMVRLHQSLALHWMTPSTQMS